MRAVVTPLDPRASRLTVEHEGAPLSWEALMSGLRADASLRDALTRALASAPVDAIFWEARPVAPEDRGDPFESVILDAPALALVRADVGPFYEALAGARAPAVRTFSNLAGDAELVVPAPDDDPAGYPHLAAFLRRAPSEQVHALWIDLALALRRRLDTRGRRVWVSTAGLGVPWLHVRLDSRPKYVKWRAYREVG